MDAERGHDTRRCWPSRGLTSSSLGWPSCGSILVCTLKPAPPAQPREPFARPRGRLRGGARPGSLAGEESWKIRRKERRVGQEQDPSFKSACPVEDQEEQLSLLPPRNELLDQRRCPVLSTARPSHCSHNSAEIPHHPQTPRTPTGEPKLDHQRKAELPRDLGPAPLQPSGRNVRGQGKTARSAARFILYLSSGVATASSYRRRIRIPALLEPLAVLGEDVNLGVPGRENRVDLFALADRQDRLRDVGLFLLGVLRAEWGQQAHSPPAGDGT